MKDEHCSVEKHCNTFSLYITTIMSLLLQDQNTEEGSNMFWNKELRILCNTTCNQLYFRRIPPGSSMNQFP